MTQSQRRRLLSAIIAATAAFTAGCTLIRVNRSVALTRASEPFEWMPVKPVRSILVVGDSTAVGTGASSPQGSVAGLIARDHPNWRITNRGRDGDTFADISQQLSRHESFDLILVLGGGNDVIKLTGQDVLRAAIRETFDRAHEMAPVVICMPAGNVGNAPFFFPPVSWLMTQRAKMLHRLIRDAAAHSGTLYVNVFLPAALDPFVKEPKAYNAADGLHPNDRGYDLWYQQLRTQAAGFF